MDLQFLANVPSLASLYALLAAGYVIVYRASRVFNLAHGELMMMGGFFFFTMASLSPVHNLALVLVLTFLLSFLAGGLIYILIMRPMAGQPLFAAILVTVALGIMLRGIAILTWSARAQYPLDILGVKNVARELPGGIILSTFDLAQIASAVALYLALFVFFRFSRLGIQMRAAAENPLLAAQRGINIHLLFALSWSIATFTAAAAGVLYASNIRLDPGIADIGLKALAVPLAGGMGSLLGAIPAAIVIAGAEIITIRGISGLWTGNPLLSNVMPFIIILIV